jgi:hypothetical protein
MRVATHRAERTLVSKKAAAKSTHQESVIIPIGGREDGKRFIRNWFSKESFKYLKICDPYFGPDDLEILKVILSLQPNIKVQVLTSHKHQLQVLAGRVQESAYRDAWYALVSDQSPPDTDIYVVGTKSSGALPIHDRWWVTDKGGIRMGTSYNSLGTKQDSEISLLSPEEANNREEDIDNYILRKIRVHNGERILFSSFTL